MPNIDETCGTPRNQFRFRKRYLALGLLCVPVFCALGLIQYFRIGSDANALRQSFMGTGSGQWDKKIAVHVGFFTMGAVRLISQFVPLPDEARAGINAVRGAEAGVYHLQKNDTAFDRATILANADRTMSRRGWQRIVGVASGDGLVAIYIPRKGASTWRMSCCVAVLNDNDLVVASASGNLEPLLQVVEKQLARTYPRREGAASALPPAGFLAQLTQPSLPGSAQLPSPRRSPAPPP